MRRFGRATGPTVSKAEVVDKVNVLIQRFGDIVDPAALVEGKSAYPAVGETDDRKNVGRYRAIDGGRGRTLHNDQLKKLQTSA